MWVYLHPPRGGTLHAGESESQHQMAMIIMALSLYIGFVYALFFRVPSSPIRGIDMTIQDDYIQHLREHGRKQTTLDGYLCGIRVCERCLRAGHRSTDPADQDEESFYYLREHLRLKETSMQTRMRAYAGFIEWVTGTNPMKKAKILWNPMHYDRVFISREEYASLLTFFSRAFHPPYRLMLMLGGMMGLRRAEIARLTVGDIHGNTLTVHGKGHGVEGNVQALHIPPEIRDELSFYLRWRGDLLKRDGISTDYLVVFTEKYGHASVPKRRTDRVSYHFAKMAELSGIRFTPHSLRRLYATSMHRAGIDIQTIAVLMRHSNPSVTYKYIQRNDSEALTVSENIGNIINIRDTITL